MNPDLCQPTYRNAFRHVDMIMKCTTFLQIPQSRWHIMDYETSELLAKKALKLQCDCVKIGPSWTEYHRTKEYIVELCTIFPGLTLAGGSIIHDMFSPQTRDYPINIYHPDPRVYPKILEHLQKTRPGRDIRNIDTEDFHWSYAGRHLVKKLDHNTFRVVKNAHVYEINPFNVISCAMGRYITNTTDPTVEFGCKTQPIFLPGMSQAHADTCRKNKLDAICAKYDAIWVDRKCTCHADYGQTMTIYPSNTLMEKLHEQCPVEIMREFKILHPIWEELKGLNHAADPTALIPRPNEFDLTRPRGATPREMYGEFYDGYRIGNRELEITLWLMYKREPFNVFPRDIMKIIVAMCLMSDAVLSLEKMFDMSLWPEWW